MKIYPKCLDWLRYFCALMLYAYGASKLAGSGQFALPPEIAQKPIGSLDGYTLAWYYFGYSHTYGTILGLTQIIGASMLLFRKSALLGAALMTPIMANIMLVNIFYFIAFGAECMAAFIFASMLLLLWNQRAMLTSVMWTRQLAEPVTTNKSHWLIRSLIVLFAVGLALFFGLTRR